ncbi:MAG: radical SAM family heme chaperone HemW [Clostridia bacterium]|nr:radical SAM family heme chaperone HemW [Clostridia bacterium]
MAGIYVHIPFCKSKCTYCDFASFPNEIGKTESYFACLYRETKGRGLQLKGKKFDTVYIGGGTPSIVPAKFIAGELKQIRQYFDLDKNAEITIELNPGTVDAEKIAAYKAAGINRFSIGLQSGFDSELKRLNRVHSAKDFLMTCNLLKGENISADILIGLWEQKAEDVKKTIDLALAGGIKHISMYALTPEVGTPIYTDYLNGELLSDDETAEIYDSARAYLKEKGFYRYEVSNFAVKGYESRHNLNYWRRGEYIGLGVAAASFIDGRRWTNTYSIDEYCNDIIFNRPAEANSTQIEGKDNNFEYIMLALRTTDGISVEDYKKTFGTDIFKDYEKAIKKNAKYLDITRDRIAVKDEYLYVENGILTDFME